MGSSSRHHQDSAARANGSRRVVEKAYTSRDRQVRGALRQLSRGEDANTKSCSAARDRTEFGTRGSWVQVPSALPWTGGFKSRHPYREHHRKDRPMMSTPVIGTNQFQDSYWQCGRKRVYETFDLAFDDAVKIQ